MSHSYTSQCGCRRCVRESHRRAAQRAVDPRNVVTVKKPRARKEFATREEQHATYIDVGPGSWDDRE